MKYNPTLHKLSNGVSVILDPMEIETTHVAVSFKTGALDERPNEYGLTHFCEHMLCKGTKRFPTVTSIKDYMEENAGRDYKVLHISENFLNSKIFSSSS